VRWSEGQGPYRCGMLMCWRVLQEMSGIYRSTYRKFDISACGGLVHSVICPQHAEERLTCITYILNEAPTAGDLKPTLSDAPALRVFFGQLYMYIHRRAAVELQQPGRPRLSRQKSCRRGAKPANLAHALHTGFTHSKTEAAIRNTDWARLVRNRNCPKSDQVLLAGFTQLSI
jgi:hypothetical protein